MKKLIVGLISVLAIVSFSNMALADNNNKRCQNVHGIYVDCSETDYTDNSVVNQGGAGYGGQGGSGYGYGGDARAYGGDGGNVQIGNSPFSAGDVLSPSAKASADSTNVNLNGNVNKNKNVNKNSNTNSNSNDNDATAVQGQVQGQGQGQVQGFVFVNTEVTTIIDFNHIAADVGKTDADLPNQENAPDTKTKGIYPAIKLMTLADAEAMAKNQGRHIDIIDSLFRTPKMGKDEIRTNAIAEGPKGELMGTITLADAGTKVNADGMFAVALVYGMSKGATHFDIISSGKDLMNQGSKAGIDFGGTASMVAKSDGSSIVGAGSTLGYSTAWSSNEYRPTMTIAFYFDITAVRSLNN